MDPRHRRPEPSPLELTEWLLRQPPPYTRGLIVNRPPAGMSHAARLFQARMWRQIARAIKYDIPTSTGTGRRWHLEIGRHTYEGSIRRARINLYLARRIRRVGS